MTPDDRTPFRRNPSLPTPLMVLLIFAITFAAFWPVLNSTFSQWDDWEQIAINQYLNPPVLKGLAKRWSGPFMNIYIPIVHTVWFLLAHFSQAYTEMGTPVLRPGLFKLTNVVVHAGTSSIVFLILARLFRQRGLALAGALLFCLHPVQVEAVAWTSGLKDLLFGFFGVACIYFYMGDANSDHRVSTRSDLLAVLMMAFACLSKPTALVMPAMLLVMDWLIIRRPWRGMGARLVPHIIIAIVCASYARHVQPVVDSDVQLTLVERLLVPPHTMAFYLLKLVWPTRLAFDYGVNWDLLAGSRALYVAWIAPVAVAAFAMALRRRVPFLAAGLLLAIIPIAPVSGITIFDFSHYSITADHYLYLPMLGIAIATASLLERLPSRVATAICVPILITLGAITTRQSLFWKDAITATLHTLEVNPRSFSSYSILAVLELEQAKNDPARLKKAEDYARTALAIRPDNPRSLNVLANVLSSQGRQDEALVQIDEALKTAPGDAQYHLARAGILGELRRGDEVIKELRTVLHLDPDHRLARTLVDKWDAIVRENAGHLPATRPAATR